jgi:acyl-CoA synthetase (AMP-forming)/AMP-acid ligase II
METEKISTAGGVPAIVLDLINSYSGVNLPHLETFTYGGAAPPVQLASEGKKLFPSIVMSQAYGMTETNSVAVSVAGDDYLNKPLSAGLPTPVNDILIVNPDTLKSVPTGESGEIWMRGPNVMKEYWRDSAATSKVLTRDGWLRSGDIGYVDDEGFLYVRDRIKDLIIRGGENVDSVSVENAIFSDTRIMECAAVGVPDKRLGELVTAIVVPKENYKEEVTEEQVIAIAASQLPGFAIPSMIIVQKESLPRNPGGKILKGPLRILAAKEWERRKHAKHSKSKAKSKL